MANALAVTVAPRPLVDDRYMFQKVQIVDAATGEIEATMDREGKLGAIEWSPDGRLLAMISAADLHDPSASSLVVVAGCGWPPEESDSRFRGIGDLASRGWTTRHCCSSPMSVSATEIYPRRRRRGAARAARTVTNDGVVYTAHEPGRGWTASVH